MLKTRVSEFFEVMFNKVCDQCCLRLSFISDVVSVLCESCGDGVSRFAYVLNVAGVTPDKVDTVFCCRLYVFLCLKCILIK